MVSMKKLTTPLLEIGPMKCNAYLEIFLTTSGNASSIAFMGIDVAASQCKWIRSPDGVLLNGDSEVILALRKRSYVFDQ